MRKIMLIRYLLIICLTSILLSGTALGIPEKQWSDSITDPLDQLLKVSDFDSNQPINIDSYLPLLSFVSEPPDSKTTLYHSGEAENPSAFYSFKVQRSLKQIIQYGFNPNISAVLLRPSSLRLSYWSEVDGKQQALPELWQYLSDLTSPIVVRGTEHVEITPDTNSGTYFSYDMERTFILFSHKGRKVMISLSNQKDKSAVGKKGLILGPDQNWDYVYTGERGVNRLGLGWVRSHIYHSNNIIIFYEDEPDGGSVRCAVFNWIKAGWAGLNMVNNQHIYNGMIRFATDFKGIIENSTLPAPEELARRLARFKQMPTEELRKRTRLYLKQLEQRYADSEKQLARLLADPDYVNDLQRKEMVSLLVREYTKVLIGRSQTGDTEYLSGWSKKIGPAKDTKLN